MKITGKMIQNQSAGTITNANLDIYKMMENTTTHHLTSKSYLNF